MHFTYLEMSLECLKRLFKPFKHSNDLFNQITWQSVRILAQVFWYLRQNQTRDWVFQMLR